jgi:hypothetical protein
MAGMCINESSDSARQKPPQFALRCPWTPAAGKALDFRFLPPTAAYEINQLKKPF